MKGFWTLFAAFWALFVPKAGAESIHPETVVYSGTLRHDKIGKTQKVRLYVFDTSKPGSTTSTYSAILALQFGGFGGPEYIGLNYDNIGFNSVSRELFLHRDDDARGRRLPTVKFRYSADGKTMEGDFFSQTEGKIGKLSMQAGWNLPEVGVPDDQLLHSLSGTYESNCEPSDGSAMVLKGLELVPARMLAEKSAAEGSLNVMNFVGTGICEFDGLKTCVALDFGNYNFFRGVIEMHEGSWTWRCQRESTDDLTCNSPRYHDCRLKRLAPIPIKHRPIPVSGLASTILDLKQKRQLAQAVDCSFWEGTFRGILNHVNGGRKQVAEIELTAFTVQNEPIKCIATGAARLYFVNSNNTTERLTYVLPQFEFDPNLADQTFLSESYSDVIINIRNDGAKALNGHWFSRLYGLLGEVTLTKDAPVPQIPLSESVFGLDGNYRLIDTADRSLHLAVNEAGFDKSSHDPYVQLKLNGYFQINFLDPTSSGSAPKVMSSRDAVAGNSYDYITDLLVFRTSGLYYGFMHAGGVDLYGRSSRYMMHSHPLGTIYKFLRI